MKTNTGYTYSMTLTFDASSVCIAFYVKEGRKYLQASEEQSYEGFGVHKFRARYQEHGDGKELLSKDLADDISLGIICAFAEEKLIQYASSGKEDRAQEC